ncbi:MAG: hypothetical protein KTR26_22540 [Flammeovirgaceae bacterium]|nr:hypothetical protein [Flammeovirgaceae bacterium]
MNILYLHGLDGGLDESKLEVIREKGHKPFAMEIDYRKKADAYDHLYEYATSSNIDFIIGASVGGYYGYWLGHELGLNQLLFNPAMPFRSVKVMSHNISESPIISSKIVLGANDETIPNNLNIDYFSTKENVKLITCEWLGHQVDLETFDEMMGWAGL